MEFVVLQSFSNYVDAHILMGRMEEEGIRCWLKDEHTVTIDPILTWPMVLPFNEGWL